MSTPTISPGALARILESRAQFLRFLRRRLPTPEIAEDLLQNALLKSIEKGSEIRDGDRVVAWFYRVLRNAIVDYYRSTGRNQEELSGLLNEIDISAETDVESEICRCVGPLVENLKPEYREALITIDLGDGRLSDLASRAGITEGNAAVRVHRARQAMRKQVEMTCGACAEHHCIDCHCRHG